MRVFLVHPALDGPVDTASPSVRVPLVEGDMPRSWTALEEEEQDRRLAETWRLVLRWAIEIGMDDVKVESNDGSQESHRWIVEFREAARRGIDGDAAILLSQVFPLNVEICGYRQMRPVMRVHETWDGMLIYAEEPPHLSP